MKSEHSFRIRLPQIEAEGSGYGIFAAVIALALLTCAVIFGGVALSELVLQ